MDIKEVSTTDIQSQPVLTEVQPTTTKSGDLVSSPILTSNDKGTTLVQENGSGISRNIVFDVGSLTEYIHIDGQERLIMSSDYVAGSSGWIIRGDGSVEFDSGTFRGDITGASGTFSGTVTGAIANLGGFTVNSNSIVDTADSFGLSSVVTGSNDVRFYAGSSFASRATAPARLYEDGSLVVTNINATGAIYATSGWIGAPTALVYEAQGINTGTSGWIRGGQTSFNTGSGYFLGYSSGNYKLSIGNESTGKNMYWDGTDLVVNGYVANSKGMFGGDGSDGALNITSGTTTINLGGEQLTVKQYSSISITGTGALAFSNPNANGSYIILKSKGNVTLTSSAIPNIDFSGLGAVAGAGGVSVSGAGNTEPGANGSDGYACFFKTNKGGGATGTPVANGSNGALPSFSYQNITSQILNRYSQAFVGAGGGGGGAVYFGTGGDGGRGGGCGIIECAGAWNFTTTNGISVAGQKGKDGSATGGSQGAGGGGGGGGGFFLGLYNTLTANSGTVKITGGTRGAYGTSGSAVYGGGGASATNAASAGAGGDGISNVISNTLYV